MVTMGMATVMFNVLTTILVLVVSGVLWCIFRIIRTVRS